MTRVTAPRASGDGAWACHHPFMTSPSTPGTSGDANPVSVGRTGLVEGTADSVPTGLPDWAEAALAAELPSLLALRRDIHAHPEVAWAERRTSDAVRAALAASGISATALPSGTALVAEIGSGDGQVVALRADMDALPISEESGLEFASTVPGVSHACGHDVHTTVLVGAAKVLAASPAPAGRVRLIFQAAEEVMPGGANEVVDAGVLADVSRAYALHCDPGLEVGLIGVRTGPITSACDMVRLTVSGPGGHTSRPQLTVDVVGVVAALADRLPYLVARHLPPQAQPTLVWGSVSAGDAANVIPRRGILSGTLRLAEREAWRQAEGIVRELATQLAAPFGAELTIDYLRGVPPVVNDERAVTVLRRAVGGALGEDALVRVEQSTGGEDFGIMTDVVPGALARLGVWDGVGAQVDLHSATFRADERAIAVGVRALVAIALTHADEV